jgi:hypothetical protein
MSARAQNAGYRLRATGYGPDWKNTASPALRPLRSLIIAERCQVSVPFLLQPTACSLQPN